MSEPLERVAIEGLQTLLDHDVYDREFRQRVEESLNERKRILAEKIARKDQEIEASGTMLRTARRNALAAAGAVQEGLFVELEEMGREHDVLVLDRAAMDVEHSHLSETAKSRNEITDLQQTLKSVASALPWSPQGGTEMELFMEAQDMITKVELRRAGEFLHHVDITYNLLADANGMGEDSLTKTITFKSRAVTSNAVRKLTRVNGEQSLLDRDTCFDPKTELTDEEFQAMPPDLVSYFGHHARAALNVLLFVSATGRSWTDVACARKLNVFSRESWSRKVGNDATVKQIQTALRRTRGADFRITVPSGSRRFTEREALQLSMHPVLLLPIAWTESGSTKLTDLQWEAIRDTYRTPTLNHRDRLDRYFACLRANMTMPEFCRNRSEHYELRAARFSRGVWGARRRLEILLGLEGYTLPASFRLPKLETFWAIEIKTKWQPMARADHLAVLAQSLTA